MISCWADEYDSDMEEEWSKNDKKIEILSEKFDKFSDRICEKKCSIDYKLFNVVNNSKYSCLMPWYVDQVNSFLTYIYKKGIFKNKIYKIVDTGANIGVDCINFLLNFPNLQLILFEIDQKTYRALCKNLLEFKHLTNLNSIEQLTDNNNKIQAYNRDFLDNINMVTNSDIVFIDAPWGGTIYKDKKNVSVYLQPEDDYYNINNHNNSKNIIIITKKLLKPEYNVKSVLLKVPYNYEFYNFENELKSFYSNIVIKYKNIYKGNTDYIAFVLICVYKKVY